MPTLVIDGQAMTEAAAIVLHLADLCPQAGLAPPPGTAERAQYYRWAFFCSNTLQPAYRDWFYPHEPAGPGHEEAAMAQAREEIEGPGRLSPTTSNARAPTSWAGAAARWISCSPS